jgi:hypothetical protein
MRQIKTDEARRKFGDPQRVLTRELSFAESARAETAAVSF